MADKKICDKATALFPAFGQFGVGIKNGAESVAQMGSRSLRGT